MIFFCCIGGDVLVPMDTVDPPFDGIPTEGEKDHKPQYHRHFRCQLLHLTNIWVSHAPTWEAKQAQWKSRNTKLFLAAKFDSKVRGE